MPEYHNISMALKTFDKLELSNIRRNRAPGLDCLHALRASLKLSLLDPVDETDDLSVDNVRMGYWTHVAQTVQLDKVCSRKKLP